MLARFFIDRPIFAWVLSLVIILIGAVAALLLPIDLYPNITPPTVQVTCNYPGASAQVVADTVAAPLELQVNGVENMLYMSSQSANDGSYTLTVTFAIGTDVNMAQVLVQNRIALAMPQLPAQVQLEGVSVLKTSPNILFGINLISPDRRYNALFLSNFATIQLVNELARIDGVGQIKVVGVGNYSMRIWLDPNKLASRSLTAVDVVTAIQNQNIQVAAGEIGQEPVPPGQVYQLPMNALGQLTTEKQFGDIILKAGAASAQANPSSPIVHVRDVAKVEMGAQTYTQSCHLDSEPSAIVAVFQLPGSNALDVANRVKARMEELKSRFPPGLEYRIVYDTTPFIRQSIDDVIDTLVEA
ncbi:MAG TPA: efflux RND transporter permease subunit, partial [Planctomycetaceae bacterium]|nr:efflux RND transporter permease subunit [Planctomycetaceae bacterium]